MLLLTDKLDLEQKRHFLDVLLGFNVDEIGVIYDEEAMNFIVTPEMTNSISLP